MHNLCKAKKYSFEIYALLNLLTLELMTKNQNKTINKSMKNNEKDVKIELKNDVKEAKSDDTKNIEEINVTVIISISISISVSGFIILLVSITFAYIKKKLCFGDRFAPNQLTSANGK